MDFWLSQAKEKFIFSEPRNVLLVNLSKDPFLLFSFNSFVTLYLSTSFKLHSNLKTSGSLHNIFSLPLNVLNVLFYCLDGILKAKQAINRYISWLSFWYTTWGQSDQPLQRWISYERASSVSPTNNI